jgi:glycosyltransferase 2 family protein
MVRMKLVGKRAINLSDELAILTVSTAAFGLCSAFVMMGWLDWLDQGVFQLFYNETSDLVLLMYFITQTASLAGFLLIAALASYRQRRLAIEVFAVGIVAYGLVCLFKTLIARPRPIYTLPEVAAHYDFTNGFGYPSGHTAIATAVACMLCGIIPGKYYKYLWGWIIIIALSRITLGVHMPLDVVGGFLVGIIAATIVKLVIFNTIKH